MGVDGVDTKRKQLTKGMTFNNIDAVESNILSVSFKGINMLEDDWYRVLISAIKHFDVDVVVLDSLSKIFFGNERDEQEAKKLFYVIKRVWNYFGDKPICFVILAHTRKKGVGQFYQTIDDLAGSREFSAFADILVKQERKSMTKINIEVISRYCKDLGAIELEIQGTDDSIKISFVGLIEERKEKASNKFDIQFRNWVFVEGHMTFKRAELQEEFQGRKFGKSTIDNKLQQYKKEGKLSSDDDFGYYTVIKEAWE
jgi:hypothetical protein